MRRSLALIALSCAVLAPPAAASTGGTSYPEPPVGGTAYGAASTARPTIGRFVVPRRVRADRVPRVTYRIDEAVGGAVRVRIAVLPLGGSGKEPLSLDQGRRATGQVQRVRWGHGTRLARGHYLVRLHAVDGAGHTLVRTAYASGRARLTVVAAPKPKKKAKPAPAPAPAPSGSTAPPPGPSSPAAASAPAGPVTAGVFPVAGAHTYGDGIGAARNGHTHQGQDILAAEGVPIVAPLAGTITSTTYQAHAAGYYVVLHSTDGRDLFFAHCQAGSFAVAEGATVQPGAPLCKVGHTGDASGPHLHFEIWVGGWHVGNGTFTDPLAQLRAWEAGRR